MKNIVKYLPTVEEQIHKIETEKGYRFEYPEWTARAILALIDVESDGDDEAVSDSGTFIGLLQMGPGAAIDVGIQNRHVLLADPELAIRAFLLYQYRYRARWSIHEPETMAIVWKSGPGSAKKLMRLIKNGMSLPEAKKVIDKDIKNFKEYLRRFEVAYEKLAPYFEAPPSCDVCIRCPHCTCECPQCLGDPHA